MKIKSAAFVLAALTAVSLFSFTGCGNKKEKIENDTSNEITAPFYKSVSDVTLEKIIGQSQPSVMTGYKGGFRQTIKYEGFEDEGLDDTNIYLCYKKTGDITELNQIAEYTDGYFTHVYMSSDRNDPYVYSKTPMGITKDDFTDDVLKHMIEDTVLGYASFDADLGEVTEENGTYIANVTISENGEEVGSDRLTIDPATGFILKVESSDNTSGKNLSVISEFTYTDDITIDVTPKTEYVEPVAAPEEEIADDDSPAEPVVTEAADSEAEVTETAAETTDSSNE